MAAMKRRFTIDEKRRLLELYDQLPRMSQRKAANRLSIAPSLLWTILHNRSRIMKGEVVKRERKRENCGRSPRLEASLWKWLDQSRQSCAPVSDLMIHRKAMDVAARMGMVSFRPSPRWYCGFKRREAIVRERYRIYPEVDHNSHPEQRGSASPAAEARPDGSVHGAQGGGAPAARAEQAEQLPVQSKAAGLVGSVKADMQTITVPSLHQMREAMKTLATGLLYRGFCDFKLLHQFEKEVASVVKRSMTQGSQDSFVA